jgi:Na+/H+ antiporter NhaD/arsenite permease-like protein
LLYKEAIICFAGNVTILAAASNIIVIEAAESRGISIYIF